MILLLFGLVWRKIWKDTFVKSSNFLEHMFLFLRSHVVCHDQISSCPTLSVCELYAWTFRSQSGILQELWYDQTNDLRSLSLITSDKIFSVANFGLSVCRFVCNQILLLNINWSWWNFARCLCLLISFSLRFLWYLVYAIFLVFFSKIGLDLAYYIKMRNIETLLKILH